MSTIFAITLASDARTIRENQSMLLSRPVTFRSRAAYGHSHGPPEWAVVDITPSCLQIQLGSPSSQYEERPSLSRSSTSKSSFSSLVRRGTSSSLGKIRRSRQTDAGPSPDMLDGSPLEFEVLSCFNPHEHDPSGVLDSIVNNWGPETLAGVEFDFSPNDYGAIAMQAVDTEDRCRGQGAVGLDQGDSGWILPIVTAQRSGQLTMRIPEELLDDNDGIKFTQGSEIFWVSKTEHLQTLEETFNRSSRNVNVNVVSLLRLHKCDGTEHCRRVSFLQDEDTGLTIESRLPTDGDLTALSSAAQSYIVAAPLAQARYEPKERKNSIYNRHSQRKALEQSRAFYEASPTEWTSSSFKERPPTDSSGAW